MKTFKKILLFAGILFLVFILYSCVGTCLYFREGAKNYERYKAYSPSSFPNTKWVCQEADVVFISDRDGVTRGYAETAEGSKLFSINFGTSVHCFNVDEYTDGVEYEIVEGLTDMEYYLNHLFSGDVVYSQEGCTLTYSADDDKGKLFGDQTGQVTLTFIKEPLTAYELIRDYPEFY